MSLNRTIQTIKEISVKANVNVTDSLTIDRIADICSDCDIDHRPEMCRSELKHIKQVH